MYLITNEKKKGAVGVSFVKKPEGVYARYVYFLENETEKKSFNSGVVFFSITDVFNFLAKGKK